MNEIVGCGSRHLSRKFRLSHLQNFYKSETTRFGNFASTRTATTTKATYRLFSNTCLMMEGSKTKWTAPVVRKQFLDFFEGKGHTVGKWWGSCTGAEFEDYGSQWTRRS